MAVKSKMKKQNQAFIYYSFCFLNFKFEGGFI